MIKRKSHRIDPRRILPRVLPSVWFFLIGVFLFIIGLGLDFPGARIFRYVGLFIVFFYVLLIVIWIILQFNEG